MGKKLTIIVAFLLLSFSSIFGQRTYPASLENPTKGRDFLLCYMYSSFNNLYNELEYVFLSSLDDSTVVTITCKEYPSFHKEFILPPHTDIYYPLYGDIDAVLNASEVVSGKAIRVRSSHPIVCIGDNGATNFRDNFAAVSEDKAGTEFRVLTYKEYYYDDNSAVRLIPQLAVAAFYSGTQVKITPTEKTLNGSPKDSTITFTLDSGECVFLQSEWVKGNLRDLSGSVITSNFPIAVFSGHPYANIPYQIGSSGGNFLMESMPPINSLGKGYVFQLSIPRAVTDTNLTDFYPGSELVRVLAVRNNTQLSLNGKPWGSPLLKGQYLDTLLHSTVLITANEPILVGDYSHSAYWSGDTTPGSAFLTTLPSLEGRCTDQTFYVRPDTFLDCKVFTAQYVQVVVERSNKSNVRMDDILIPDTLFSDVPGTFDGKEFSIGSIKTSPGKQHRLQVPGKSENGFIFIVYGASGWVDCFGAQSAYAYSSQMLYRNSDGLSVTERPSVPPSGIRINSIYPVPSSGSIFVRVSAIGNMAATIAIYSSIGERVHSEIKQLHNGESVINIDTWPLPNGSYVLKLYDNTGRSISEKFVIAK